MIARSIISRLVPTLAIGAAVIAVGCSSAPIETPQVKSDLAKAQAARKKQLEKSRVIAPGYLLRINHSADPKLSGEHKVNFRGTLKLPLRGDVPAAGMTTEALEQNLEKAYSGYFKVKNTVSVEIVSRDYLVEIRGLVAKPGIYPVRLDTGIEELLSLAGGFPGEKGEATGAGKPEYVRIVRPEGRSEENGPAVQWIKLSDYFAHYDPSNEVLWQGGERVFFQLGGDTKAGTSVTVQVLGEVHRPGEYPVQRGMDLLAYIGKAGGPTATANLSRVVLFRKSLDSASSYDLGRSLGPTDLSPGDVILVESTNVRPGFFERVAPTLISAGNLVISVIILLLTL